MSTTTWLLVAGGVGFVLYQKEQNRIKIAANRGAEGAVNATSRGVVNVIDETFGALGRFIGGLGRGSSSGSSSSSSTSSSSYSPDTYFEDLYDYGDV